MAKWPPHVPECTSDMVSLLSEEGWEPDWVEFQDIAGEVHLVWKLDQIEEADNDE